MKRISILVIAVLVVLCSCSTLKIQVDSDPAGADVYLKEGKKLKNLGTTPVKIEPSNLGGLDNIQLLIKKEGYQSHSIFMANTTLSSDAEVFASLQKSEIADGKAGAVAESSPDVQRSLASIQTELIKKNYQQAEVLAKTFLDKSPFSPVGWNLLGNAYLLQNRNQEALSAYEKALIYDPENKETQMILRYLQTQPVRRNN